MNIRQRLLEAILVFAVCASVAMFAISNAYSLAASGGSGAKAGDRGYSPALVVDDFDATSNAVSTWWDRGEDSMYSWGIDGGFRRSGYQSMRITYSRTEVRLDWDFFAVEPMQDGVRNDFSRHDRLVFWLYVSETHLGLPFNILVKLEDAHGNSLERRVELERGERWQIVEILFKPSGRLDLTRVKNILFFAEPAETPTEGEFWIDDLMLVNYAETAMAEPSSPHLRRSKDSDSSVVWSDPTPWNTAVYELQVADTEGFTEPAAFWLNESLYSLHTSEPGIYYFRVRGWTHLPHYDGWPGEWSDTISSRRPSACPTIGEVGSFAASDTDNEYAVGSLVRVFATEESGETDIISASVRIQSTKSGYDSGVQELTRSENQSYWFWHWNTAGLEGSADYEASFAFADSSGQEAFDDTLSLELFEFVPVTISLLHEAEDADLSKEGGFLPFERVYNHELEDETRLGLGSGWIHTYGSYLKEYADGAVEIVWSSGELDMFMLEGDRYLSIRPETYPRLGRHTEGFEVTRKDGKTYYFDRGGRLSEIEKDNGMSLWIEYLAGHIDVVRDEVTGRMLQFEYDDDRLSEVVTPMGHRVRYHYDAHGQLESSEDIFSRVTRYEYHEGGRLSSVSAADGTTIGFDFGDDGRLSRIIDNGASVRTAFLYDDASNTVTAIDALGNRTQFTYNTYGRAEMVVDALGHASRHEYDAAGNRIGYEDTLGAYTSWTYGTDANVTSETDSAGNTTFFRYDSDFNRPTEIIDRRGFTTQVAYDIHGNVDKVADAGGAVTEFAYDANGLLIGVDGPSSDPVEFQYEGVLLLSATDGLGSRTSWFYDPYGRVSEKVDGNGHSTRYEYRGASLASETSAAVVTTRYEQDDSGWLSAVVDGKGNAREFEHDALGRLIGFSFADHSGYSLVYDALGRLAAVQDRSGKTFQYRYDAVGRLLEKTNPDGSQLQFSYDAAGNLIRAASEEMSLRLEYDLLGNILRYEDGFGNSIRYEYDAEGNPVRLTLPDGNSLLYVWDEKSQLAEVSDSISGGTFELGYDGEGRLTRIARPNAMSTTCRYDAIGRLAEVTHYSSEGSAWATYKYQFDNVGNRTLVSTPDGEVRHEYDAINQLTGFSSEDLRIDYAYDEVGNRTEIRVDGAPTEYASNILNQYTRVGETSFQYDSSGNLVRKTSTEGATEYSYDNENRLVSIAKPSGEAVDYRYDPLGRLVERRAGRVDTRFIYDGWRVLAETDGTGSTKATYIYGSGLDQLLATVQEAETRYYFHDGIGNVVAVANGSCEIVERYEYLPFGQGFIRSASGEMSQGFVDVHPSLFTGRLWDSEAGLYYFRHRFYDPEIGRFLSPEPRLQPSDTNLYTYVGNNPVNLIDPLGLCGTPPNTGPPNGDGDGNGDGDPGYNPWEYPGDPFPPDPELPKGIRFDPRPVF